MLGKHQVCMQCQQNQAAVKLTKLVKGTVEELWLCPECAARHSPFQKKNPTINLNALLNGILAQAGEEAEVAIVQPDLNCPTCGMPFATYRTTLLLGCSDCYEAFETHLVNDLRKFHGETVHLGRSPRDPAMPVTRRRSATELRRRLDNAVAAENFELAAKLRDEIRRISEPEVPHQS